jgi:hypothetical protein
MSVQTAEVANEQKLTFTEIMAAGHSTGLGREQPRCAPSSSNQQMMVTWVRNCQVEPNSGRSAL